jgi:transposase
MKVVYTGLDVGSRFFQIAAMEESGELLFSKKMAMSEENLIAAFSGLEGEVHVHLEAGEMAPWIRDVIRRLVHRVVISHPMNNAWIAKDPNKCDRVDAIKLADLLRMNRFREVYYSDDRSRREFKLLVQHYNDLTKQQARIKRKIKARFRAQGIIVHSLELFTVKGKEKALGLLNSDSLRKAVEQLYDVLEQSQTAQQQARQLMCKEGQAFPEIKLLQSVPGVGPIGAARFSAYIQDPTRFSSRRKLWRYCRLGVSFRSSDGEPLSHPRLDHNGCGVLKDVARVAFTGALRAKVENSFQRAYKEALKSTHNAVHARLSVMRKIVSVMRIVWITNTPYRDDLG